MRITKQLKGSRSQDVPSRGVILGLYDRLQGFSDRAARRLLKPLLADQRVSDDEVFDVNNLNHPLVKRYAPLYLWNGGENLVYRSPGHGSVLKIRKHPLVALIDRNLKSRRPIDTLSDQSRVDLDEIVAAEGLYDGFLSNYFGRDQVLSTSRAAGKVPIREAAVVRLFNECRLDPDLDLARLKKFWSNEAWTVISTQANESKLVDPSHLSICAYNCETGEHVLSAEFKDSYDRLTGATLWPKAEQDFDPRDLGRIYPELETVMRCAWTYPSARQSLKEFVQGAVRFTDSTGQLLDIAGSRNIIMFREGDTWRYRLIDVFNLPGDIPDVRYSAMDSAHAVIEGLNSNHLRWLEPDGANNLMVALNYARGVNGLAMFLEIPDRIQILKDEPKFTPADLREAIVEQVNPGYKRVRGKQRHAETAKFLPAR